MAARVVLGLQHAENEQGIVVTYGACLILPVVVSRSFSWPKLALLRGSLGKAASREAVFAGEVI